MVDADGEKAVKKMAIQAVFPRPGADLLRPLGCAMAAVAVMAVMVFLSPAVPSLASEPGEESEECLGCHDDEELDKTLLSGERLRLYINLEEYVLSAHGDLDCTDCHGGISTDDHPEERDIAGLNGYRREQSGVCGDCHDEERDSESSMHRYLTAGYGQLPCSDCHRPHRSPALSAWKADLGESGYCLECHTRDLNLLLGNGDMLSLNIDPLEIGVSVHLSHECTDCHGEFSRESHPARDFSGLRQHSVVLAGVCTECHDEAASAYDDSIHHTLLAEGNLSAPVCTDCHGFHAVREAETMAQLSGLPCRKCHGEVFEAFALSRHGAGQAREHFTTPLCADCHQTHAIKQAYWGGKVKAACLACHGEITALHRAWLPNAGIHLEAVACPSCHAPAAERGVDLVLGSGSPSGSFSREELKRILGAEDCSTGEMNGLALWRLLRRARQAEGGGEASFEGRMVIRTGVAAHRLVGPAGALRDCASCHDPHAAAFDSLTVTVMMDDGTPLSFQARGEALGSISSIDSLKGFYMLAGTRIRTLDLLLVLAILGGMSVPALHMTARLLAAGKTGKGTS